MSAPGTARMRYGAMNFPIVPLADEIERIADLGFDYLELAMDAPEAHHARVRDRMDAVSGRLQARGLGLVCHLPTFVSAADLTPGIRDASVRELLDALRLCADLGAEKVVAHPAMIGGLAIHVEDLARGYADQALERLASTAADLGLTICLENMFPRCRNGCEPHDFDEIFDRFPGMRLTLDTGHANIDGGNGRRLAAFLRRWPRRIGHVHISDNNGLRDEHLPVGAGTVDFAALCTALRRNGYDDTMTLEIFTGSGRDLLRSRRRIETMLAAGGR